MRTKPFLFAWIEFIASNIRRKHCIAIFWLILLILMEVQKTLCKLQHLWLIFLRWMHIILISIFHIRYEILIGIFLHNGIVGKRLGLAV